MKKTTVVLLLLTGCGQGYGGVPGGDQHGYILIEPATQQQGWAVVDAINRELPAADRQRIRVADAAGAGATMVVDFNGDCARDAAFVGRVRRISARYGVAAVRCSVTPPAG